MSLETNSDLIFAVVAEMVKYSDAEFAAFWKKNFFKKRESEAPKEVEAIFEVEAIPSIPISKVVVAEAPDVALEVPRGARTVEELIEVHDTPEVPETVEAPAREGSAS